MAQQRAWRFPRAGFKVDKPQPLLKSNGFGMIVILDATEEGFHEYDLDSHKNDSLSFNRLEKLSFRTGQYCCV
jgi:hypothetical protein